MIDLDESVEIEDTDSSVERENTNRWADTVQSMNLSGVDVYGAPAQPVDDESILGKKVPLAFVPGKPPQKSARQDAVFESDYEPA